MTDQVPGPTPGTPAPVPVPGTGRSDTLGLRLALAFLGVALGAVALLAGLTAAFSAADVSALANRQRHELTSAIAVAAGAAWGRNDSWSAADLSPVLDLATQTGTDLALRAGNGQPVATTPGFGANTGPESSAPVVESGQRIGAVAVRSTGSGLGKADHGLETALLRAIAGAAGLGAL